MKLKIFRIISLICLSLVALAGVALAILNIIFQEQGLRSDSSYIILLIALLIGAFFSGFEAYFVIKSFKEGTLLLHSLCMHDNRNRKKLPVLIIASVICFLVICGLIFNVLIYTGTINLNQSLMTCEFNMYYCVLIAVNTLMVITYWLFIVLDDIEIGS